MSLELVTAAPVLADGIVDAKAEADTEVVVEGTATVTVAPYHPSGWSGYGGYGAPPGASHGQPDWESLGKYVDVYVPDTAALTQIEIRLYYTDAEVQSFNETTLRLFWWNSTAWAQCSDGGVNTSSTGNYSGYMWARVTAATTPSLAALNGTPWGGYGHPSVPPGACGCFIATAAYGTDTAKEIDILREFRDEALLPNSLGARLVSFYYRTSPPIADCISQHEILTRLVRLGFLDPVVRILNWTQGLWSVRRL